MQEPSARGLAAFGNRDYTIFWCGALLSNCGTWLQALVVPYVLFQLTGSALWVGLASAAQFLPMVVMSPLGGSLADRRSRRSVLLTTQTGMALTALGLLIAWTAGVASPWVLLFFTAVAGVLNGITMPSWQAFVSDLVPRELLLSAVTLNSVQFNAARAIGPAVAGVVLALLGPGWAFALNALSFGCVIIALLIVRARTVRVPRVTADGVWLQFRDAARYTSRQPALLLIVMISGLVGALGNPIFGFTVVFAGVVYLVGPVALGLLNVAPGVGAVLATPVVTGWRRSPTLSRTVRWALVGYAIAIIVFGAVPSYGVGMIALVFVGGCFLAVVSGVNTSLQLIVDDHYRGRVMALRLMVFTLAVSVGGLVQGAVADRIGPRPTVVASGVLLLVCGVVIGRLRGRYRLSQLDGGQARAVGHPGEDIRYREP